MDRIKRLFYVILLNVMVSAVTVLLILNWWNRAQPLQPVVTQVVIMVTAVGGSGQTPVVLTAAPEATLPSGPIQTSTETTVALQSYQVQSGDTLSSIALQFRVGMEDILRVNDLDDPNSLQVGMMLQIPGSPLPTYTPVVSPTLTFTPTRTPEKTATPTLTPTPDTSPARLAIERVLGAGSVDTEQVRLVHQGGMQADLSGWRLEGSQGGVFTFPGLLLFPGGVVTVHTRGGLNTVNDLYWGLDAAAWHSGETLTLRDLAGEARAIYQIP